MKSLDLNAMKSVTGKMLTRAEMKKVLGGNLKWVACYCGEERTHDVECDSPLDCSCQCAEACGGVQC